jgi:uncharacterized protein YndB with AHSA1/START domain
MAIAATTEVQNRPNQCVIRTRMNSNPRMIYEAWTTGWEKWFAAPGTLKVEPKVGGAYSFETEHEGKRHPHHGRYLRLEKDRLVEITWTTGEGGTEGAETIVSVELESEGTGAVLDLKHSGFPNEESMQQHDKAWVMVLGHLDKVLSGRGE